MRITVTKFGGPLSFDQCFHLLYIEMAKKLLDFLILEIINYRYKISSLYLVLLLYLRILNNICFIILHYCLAWIILVWSLKHKALVTILKILRRLLQFFWIILLNILAAQVPLVHHVLLRGMMPQCKILFFNLLKLNTLLGRNVRNHYLLLFLSIYILQ